MEKTMETTIMGLMGYIMGLYWDNGKENGNDFIVYWGYIGMTCSILGLYRAVGTADVAAETSPLN